MSDHKTNQVNDSEFDRELAVVSRAYQLADAELPPPAMDDAIRAAARRAVKSQPHVVGKSWISRWSAPLSAAALVVLAVSVGFVALEQRPDLAPAVVSELTVRMPAEKAATGAHARATDSPTQAKLEAPQAAGLTPMAEKKVLAENRAVVKEQIVQSPTIDLARSRTEQTNKEPVVLAKDLNVAEAPGSPPVARPSQTIVATVPVYSPPVLVAVAPAAAPAPPPPKELQSFVADPVAGASARKESFAAAESAKREVTSDKQVSGQIAGLSGASRSDAMAALKAQTQVSANTPMPPALASRPLVAPPVYAPATAATPAAPAASMADTSTESPNAWIKRILELKRQGKTREFEDELVKFRKRYPDYQLPEELAAHK